METEKADYYKVEIHITENSFELQEWLQTWHENGWKLVAVNGNYYIFVLRAAAY